MNSIILQADAELRQELASIVRDWPHIVCFANDWNGDPTSKHHIMRALASATDVLWVESSGMRRPKLSSVADLRRVVQRLRRAAGSAARTPEGRVRVVSPMAVPLPGNRLAQRVNAALYARAVSRVTPRSAQRPPLLWVYTPTVAPYLPRFRSSGLVYHCVDRWWAFGDYDGRTMRRHHEELCRRANVVFASAAALLEDCREHTDRAYLLPHGVEWGHFARAALEPQSRPADIESVRSPIIGFFGLIHEWIDQDLLAHVAEHMPEATILLIGKVQTDVERLRRYPNIRFVGQKRYDELPAYSAAFDVAIIPFVVNELTLAVNPIKLREYLSAGLPVVATALPEIRALEGRPNLHVADTHESFTRALRETLGAGVTAEDRREAAMEMADESWAGRCVEIARVVDEHLRA